MLNKLDEWLDRITMYRLLLYYLIGLIAIAIVLGTTGALGFSPSGIAGSALYLVAICWVINRIFSKLLNLPSNGDSTLITALILALILPPQITTFNLQFLTAAAGLAIASKYLLTINQKHIFNPAAIAVLLLALGPKQTADWWVGSPAMMVFVLIGGFLLTRRIRRGVMVTTFFVTSLIAVAAFAALANASVVSTLHQTIFSSALLFMGFVMLTEPLTSPATKTKQIWYSLLDGVLFSPRVHLGSLFSTPELVLSIGNVFSYILGPRIKLFPKLVDRHKITPDSMDFVFDPGKKFDYKAGQYMEWTLPHESVDSRGQRRYFTLASSPTEKELRLGVKFYQHGSSYKRALLEIGSDVPISATSLGGDFVLPSDQTQPLIFIAGGIGITPFRSMIKYMVDKNDKRAATLIYSANRADDIAYKDIFQAARLSIGLKVLYILSARDAVVPDKSYYRGNISAELLKSIADKNTNGLFYISGPHPMVDNVKNMLQGIGISRRNIKTDFFSGYA